MDNQIWTIIDRIREANINKFDWRKATAAGLMAASAATGAIDPASASSIHTPVMQHQVQSQRHFKEEDFACHHCGKVKVSTVLMGKLEKLRTALGNKPIIITSGYRCPEHNSAVGGAKNSQHLYGNAADIKVTGVAPSEVARKAKEVGFSWVKAYSTWTHVDVR